MILGRELIVERRLDRLDECLSACSFYDILSAHELQLLRSGFLMKSFARPQSRQLEEFAAPGALYIVSRGNACIHIDSLSGHRCELASLSAGAYGIMSLSPKDCEYELSVDIASDTLVYLADSETVDTLKSRNPRFNAFCYQNMRRQLSQMVYLVGETHFSSLRVRLEKYLSNRSDEGRRELNMTHSDLADVFGTSREVISRLLKELEREGIISQKRCQIAFHPSAM